MRGAPQLKPQDVLILLKLLLWEEREPWSFAVLASSLGMSASEVHAAIKRAETSGLYDPLTKRPKRLNLAEFIVHGLRYAFPALIGKRTKGVPTAHSAPPLAQELVSREGDCFVWPVRGAKTEGLGIAPLYPSVPKAVKTDERLYELLALIDALRIGRARDHELAKEHLSKRLARA
jgi:hypothetical protein